MLLKVCEGGRQFVLHIKSQSAGTLAGAAKEVGS